MQRYRCDWCGREKSGRGRWLVGLAAERVGATERRREVCMAERWSEEMARHELAVHFCCAEHRKRYIDLLLFEAEDDAGANRRGNGSAPVSVARGAQRKKKSRTKSSRHGRKPDHKFDDHDTMRAHALGIKL